MNPYFQDEVDGGELTGRVQGKPITTPGTVLNCIQALQRTEAESTKKEASSEKNERWVLNRNTTFCGKREH